MIGLSEEFELSEALEEEERDEALSGAAPIDLERPGFASLHTVLLGVLADTVPDEVLTVYLEALEPRLIEAHRQFKALIDELSANPQDAPEEARTAAHNAAASLDRLRAVLVLLRQYLDDAEQADLELIEQALDGLEEVRGFASTL